MKTLLHKFSFGLIALLLLSCSEPAYRIHEKLDVILQNDLRYIVAEIQKGSGKTYLLDEPYFTVKDLRFFEGDTARIYSAYVEVDFFYFKGINMFQKRKYRYDARYRNWDRYFKKLEYGENPPGKLPNSSNFPEKPPR
jgi:hypothetical protein